MSDDAQAIEGGNEVKRARNSPKHSQATWAKVKMEFEDGSYTSLAELSRKYGINPITLRTRMVREQWNERQRALQSKVEQKIEEVKVDIGKEYLLNSFSRSKKYEKIIDASLAQLGANAEGIPLVEPSDLDAFTRSELRIHELAKSALRIPTVASVDLTTKGLSFGESIVTAIRKLRENPSQIVDITPEQIAMVKDMEVVD